jgi:hypothetical protein
VRCNSASRLSDLGSALQSGLIERNDLISLMNLRGNCFRQVTACPPRRGFAVDFVAATVGRVFCGRISVGVFAVEIRIRGDRGATGCGRNRTFRARRFRVCVTALAFRQGTVSTVLYHDMRYTVYQDIRYTRP